MRVFYLDTSALIKHYVSESGTEWVDDTVYRPGDNLVLTSRITMVEAWSALARRRQEASISPQHHASALAAFRETGQARWLNRGSWMEADLFGKLEDAGSLTSQLFRELCRRLRLRRRLPAFHPLAAQRVLDLDPRCFAVVRSGPNGNKSLLALHNVSARPLRLATDRLPPPWNSGRAFKNALAPDRPLPARAWHLAPYEAAWVVGADACPPAEPGPAY